MTKTLSPGDAAYLLMMNDTPVRLYVARARATAGAVHEAKGWALANPGSQAPRFWVIPVIVEA